MAEDSGENLRATPPVSSLSVGAYYATVTALFAFLIYAMLAAGYFSTHEPSGTGLAFSS